MHKVMAACALAALSALLGSAAAGSVCSLEVSPLTLELRVEPGRAHTGAIEIKNSGAEPQHIRAYCQDWALRPDGLVVFIGAGRLPDSASEWVLLAPTEFDLSPGGSQSVRYTIRPPLTAVGEARTVIIFEAGSQAILRPGAPSRVVPRLGTILYVQCGETPPAQARVAQFRVGPEGGLLVVENTGRSHLRFTGHVEVRRAGELVRAADLTSFVVLPAPFNQHHAKLPREAFAGLPAGEYEVTAILDCGGPSLLGARTNLTLRPETSVQRAEKPER